MTGGVLLVAAHVPRPKLRPPAEARDQGSGPVPRPGAALTAGLRIAERVADAPVAGLRTSV